MGKTEIRWLYRELQGWVDNGLVTEEAAARLRSQYGPIEEASAKNIALIICGALGALLIGGGVFLLLAHNWDGLSRPARTAISLGLLVVAQCLGGWVMWSRAGSRAWREGSATFQMLAVGAAILLISQTYQMAGNPNDFLLVWMLLSIPLVYLMDVSLPAIGFMIGITAWGGSLPPNGHWYWLVAALVVPHLRMATRRFASANWTRVLFGFTALMLPIAVGVTLGRSIHAVWVPAQSALLALLYLAGRKRDQDGPEPWQQPLHLIGALGTVVVCFVLSFRDPWSWIARGPTQSIVESHGLWFDVTFLSLLGAGAALLLWLRVRKGLRSGILFGIAPAIVIPAYLAVRAGCGAWLGVATMNVYLLALGVATVADGLIGHRIMKVNAGMLVIASLIIARFFDSDLGFVIRGLVFILVGLGFLAANVWLVRQVKEAPHEK